MDMSEASGEWSAPLMKFCRKCDYSGATPDELCPRCTSEEIYPAVSRARAFARALILSMFGGFVVQFIVIVSRTAGVTIPHKAVSAAFLVVLAAPVITAVAINISPRMICSNCHHTWCAGKNRPS